MAKSTSSEVESNLGRYSIEYVGIDTIRPYWRNPRINDATVALLKESITRYGFLVPIVVDKDSVIVTGHARYKASRELGFTDVPVIFAELDEEKAKEFRLVDNSIPEESQWEKMMLTLEMRELDTEGLQLFFPKIDLPSMVAESIGASIKPIDDEVIEKAKEETLDNQLQRAERAAEYQTTCPSCGHDFSFTL